jgi:hypothetical protein
LLNSGVDSGGSSEEVESVVSSNPLVEFSLKLLLSSLGVLALNLGVQVVELDVAGVDS